MHSFNRATGIGLQLFNNISIEKSLFKLRLYGVGTEGWINTLFSMYI